jgi:tRNA/rRNA methyltransferase
MTRRANPAGESLLAPVIVLVRPQLGQNIGAAARAMLNCGLDQLRLVSPRDGWPNSAAFTAAAHADQVLKSAKVFAATSEAIADCARVYATTARHREMLKPVTDARGAARMMREDVAAGRRVAVMFGPERTGLENEDVVLAQTIVRIPLNPAFASLNLAQAVLLMGYEWMLGAEGDKTLVQTKPSAHMPLGRTRLARAGEIAGFFAHLETELDQSGFFANIPEKRAAILRNIRNIFQRVPLMEQDIRTLRGVIKALAWGRPKRPPRRGRAGP